MIGNFVSFVSVDCLYGEDSASPAELARSTDLISSERAFVKRLIALTALLVAAPSLGAQTSSAPIGVTAKVQSAVTLSGMVPLDFGAGIVPGTPATVTPANGGRIMASYNVSTQLSLPNTVTLTRVGG